jgi:hypothetical protein
MKKLVSILILLLSFVYVANAQTWYRATSYKKASVTNGNYSWGGWKPCNMKVSVDRQKLLISIYGGKTVKKYVLDLYSADGRTDSDGTDYAIFKANDQDGDKCSIVLRESKDGARQIFIFFSNVAWAYKLKKTS